MMDSTTHAKSIGEKSFGADDLALFARLSLDRNPIHTDPVASRRLLTGTQLAHGSHLLLTALELGLEHDVIPARVASIRCNYPNPVSCGDRVNFSAYAGADNSVRIDASVGGLPCCQLIISAEPDLRIARPREPAVAAETWQPEDESLWSRLTNPCDEPPEFHCGKHYAIALNHAPFETLFPRAMESLGRPGVAAIASFSYMVGMVCPGLHSMTSSLQFKLQREAVAPDTLVYSVDKYDPRMRLFHLSFEGYLSGTIKAFHRPAPQQQPTIAEILEHVVAGEFAGSQSLVIGGSRGLGELTAKMLAVGGGDVIVSYAVGRDDAQALCAELETRSPGHCKLLKIDVRHDSFDALPIDWQRLDAVYYYATPRISRKKADLFDRSVWAEFVHCYVEKFYELCLLLESLQVARKIKVFLPSTSALSERPKGMTEYAMAKVAAEALAEDVNRAFRNVTVVTSRLPRLATDQTATLLKVETASGVDVLLPLLRTLKT